MPRTILLLSPSPLILVQIPCNDSDLCYKKHYYITNILFSLYSFHKWLPNFCCMAAKWKLNHRPNSNLKMFWRTNSSDFGLLSLIASTLIWGQCYNPFQKRLRQDWIPMLNKTCDIRASYSVLLYDEPVVIRIYSLRTPVWK